MAAISFYQPCRSHLAQPARCFDEDPPPPPPLSLRRRQYIERCYETRTPRYPDPIPEVSIEKTRVVQPKNGAPAPQNRRLNVDYGWSKVEEVRKKFEGAAAAASYSRSFESPPRRRLADSLFASFKLPRRKEASMSAPAPRSLAPQHHQPKRKSAVEMLAETKAFYVKSETVLDRKQELPLRVSSGLSQAIAAGGCHLVSSGTLSNDAYTNPYATTRRPSTKARRCASAGEGLQSTLRRLLGHESMEPQYQQTAASPHKPYTEPRRARGPSGPASGTVSGTSSSGTSGCRIPRAPPRPRSFGESSLPPDVLLTHIPSPQSSPDSPGLDPDQIGTISPPAQYAHTQPRFIRCNSHSQPSVHGDEYNSNINSHKSLPDLHTDMRAYTEHSGEVYPETRVPGPGGVRSPRRRHSSHLRTASCSSKGTRSNHSSLMSSSEVFSEHPSPGDDTYQYSGRSGGCVWTGCGVESASSGRYTNAQREHDHRMSGLSSLEAALCAPPQFADGAPPAPPAPPLPHRHDNVTIHFQASAPPPQFQDEVPPFESYDYRQNFEYTTRPGKDKEYTYPRDFRYKTPEGAELITKQPQYAEMRARTHTGHDQYDYSNAHQGLTAEEQLISPLGTFRRQRCLRYKQRPIARSKSDISDRYRRTEGRSPASAPCEADDSGSSLSSGSERLRGFFDRLGLGERQYEELLASSPADTVVYFSSVSSVDSNQMQDFTVQGPPPQPPIYRNTEPPSIVERNARIVKWLCQCRKVQQATPH